MHEMQAQRLAGFVTWVGQHIKGDEKGEAQIFLDRLFQAFGQKGAKEVGGAYEERVKNDAGGTSFADYVWKPIVLIEMKKRGADLSKHYRQAFEYWTRLVPNRPRYVVLCNFDAFAVYDFDRQLDAPVDTVGLAELPQRYGPLAFLFPTKQEPTFGNDRVAVTRDAADRLAVCFNKLIVRKVDRDLAQRFILQSLVALFAEDIGLLPKYLLTHLLDECKDPPDAYDKLGGLFAVMNDPKGASGGRYKGVRYFNGGLFTQPARVELYEDELNQLKKAAEADWSKVSPDIFGTLFEHSLGKEERHAYGAHYTAPIDIMKIVKPTISDPWTQQIEGAKTLTRLRELLQRMHTYTVLDPACGSGNFLYLAYRELKRLEARTIERMREFASVDAAQGIIGFVTARQFFGLDINPFAIELAKVTMMIARKLAIDELHVAESDLPLDNLDQNFKACDALIDELGNPTEWPKADVIIGNPPFMGAKRFKPERGVDYVRKVRRAFPDVPGMADYCVYWFRRAHDHLPPCTTEDPVAGRAGLVGTQNIRNNQSRVGGLDHIVASGSIVEAVDNQPWSGEAVVHVSIANWLKTKSQPSVRTSARLWSRIDDALIKPRQRVAGDVAAAKQYELASRDVPAINASLSDDADVAGAALLTSNDMPKRVFQGVTPGHDGFVLSHEERAQLLRSDPHSAEVTHPYLTGRELVSGDGKPDRHIIDFQRRDVVESQTFPGAFTRVRTLVLPNRMANAEKGKDADGKMRSHHRHFLERWWALAWDRKELFSGFAGLAGRFIACSRVTKRPIFVFFSTNVWPSDKIQCFLFDDDYSFGILHSVFHWEWFTAKCSKLKSDFSYSTDAVFNTFPWPQSPTKKLIDAVGEAGCEVRRVRAESLEKTKGGLRAVYRTLELPGKNPLKDAHAALDAAVLEAYSFSPKKDILAQLLALNHEVAAKIKAGEPVTAPGVPPTYGDPAALITDDCIRP
ncbi:MAG: Mtase [Phycisphaerales bacterium]|nr:Mtase [Phycisphaerales bacterium]